MPSAGSARDVYAVLGRELDGTDYTRAQFTCATEGKKWVANHFYNTNTLQWEPATGGATGTAVTVSNFPATQAVTQSGTWTVAQGGSPWGVTVSGSVAVTGTFWQATQPVSGTFWQATQPVSIASMPSTPVTGTFWQATQPVSIASMPSTPVTGTFWQATQPVSSTNLDVALSTRLKPADTLTGVTTVTSITNPVTANGDVDHDAANTLKNIQVAGHASPCDVPPASVSANGDRARIWVERTGAIIVRNRKIRETYTAVFRLAEAAVRLDQTFTQVANTNKQWATIYHAVGATKEVDLVRLVCYITAWSVATQAVLELRELTGGTAPATGNPAITPKPRRVGGTAAEVTCLYLPTTQGTETAVNSPLASIIIDEGVMGAASIVNPLPNQEIVLYDGSKEDDESLLPTLPVGTAGGWAVMLRAVGAPAVRMTVVATFTEEIP